MTSSVAGMRAASRARGVPDMSGMQPCNDEAAEYVEARRTSLQAVQDYAKRVHALREVLHSSMDPTGFQCILLSHECRLDAGERSAVVKAVVHDKSFVKQALLKRCPSACGVGPGEAYMLRYADGRVAAMCFPSVFTDEVAGEAAVEWAAVHSKCCNSWTQGCEADPPVLLDRLVGNLRNDKIVAGTGITGACKLTRIGARTQNVANNATVSKHSHVHCPFTVG